MRWGGVLGRTDKGACATSFAGFRGAVAQAGGFVRSGGGLTFADNWPAFGLTDTVLTFDEPDAACTPAMDLAATLPGRRNCWPTNMV